MHHAAEKKTIKSSNKKKTVQLSAKESNKKPFSGEIITQTSTEKKRLKPSAMLAPVPVVMVSCCDITKTLNEQEQPAKDSRDTVSRQNLITIAWAGTVCSDPPMVSIAIRRERYSYELIRTAGEFVVNTVSRSLTEAADFCGVRSGRDVDKFAACGLTAVPAAGMKKTMAVAESPLTLSCRLKDIVSLGSHDLFIGEIVAVEAHQTLFDSQDRLCLEKADLVAFAHGQYYSLGAILGFFGYSVASEEVLKRRMPKSRQQKNQLDKSERKKGEAAVSESKNRQNNKRKLKTFAKQRVAGKRKKLGQHKTKS